MRDVESIVATRLRELSPESRSRENLGRVLGIGQHFERSLEKAGQVGRDGPAPGQPGPEAQDAPYFSVPPLGLPGELGEGFVDGVVSSDSSVTPALPARRKLDALEVHGSGSGGTCSLPYSTGVILCRGMAGFVVAEDVCLAGFDPGCTQDPASD